MTRVSKFRITCRQEENGPPLPRFDCRKPDPASLSLPPEGEREGEETEKGDSCPFRLHINPALVFRYVNASLYLDQYLGLYNTLGSVDPLRRWTHAAGFTGVCACTTRADTYTCVRCNCRTRQTGYPRGSSTPTPHRDTDSNTERGQGEGEATPLPPLRIVRAGTPRLFCPSFLSIFPPPHAGVTRDPTQRLHAHTLVYRPTHRATMFETAIRISPREVCGVASRTIRRTMHFSTILDRDFDPDSGLLSSKGDLD